MIFVDSVEKNIVLGKYLQTLLSDNLKDREKKIIVSFLLILKTKIKTNYLKNLINGDIRIINSRDVIGIGVDILDIKHIIQ